VQEHNRRLVKMSKFKQLCSKIGYVRILLAGVILTGLFFRLFNLGGDPLWKIELYQSWAARRFLEGYNFTLPSGEVFYSRSFLTSTIPITLSFTLFGYTEFAARLPSVFFGVLTIFVVYLTGKELLNSKYGLIVSFMFSLSYWAITWSTQARMYAQTQFFYILGVLLVLKWYKKGFKLKTKEFASLVLVSTLGVHNDILYASIVGVILIFTVLSMFKHFKDDSLDSDLSVRKIRVIVSILVAIFTYVSLRGVPIWFTGYTPDWYEETRGALFYLDWLNDYIPYMFLVASGLVITTLKKEYWLLSISFLAPFAAHSLLFELKEPRYIFHLYPSFILIASINLYYLHRYISSIDRIPRILPGLTVLIIVIALQAPLNTVENMSYNSHGMMGTPPDHEGPSQYITENMREDHVVVSTEPIKTQWYMEEPSLVDYDINPLNPINKSGETVDEETGVKKIETASRMEEILEDKSGWIVKSDKNFYRRVPEDLRSTIKEKELREIEDENWTDTKILKF